MNSPSNTPDLPANSGVGDPGYNRSSRQAFYWSVRRELWENRSIYVAPLIVAAVVLFGSFVSSFHLPERRRMAMLLDPAHRRAAIEMHYDIAAMMIIITAFIVGVFYCLDALHSERRDRSILFWKSLPVSDLTTVLSKASVPLAILPVIVLLIVVVMQFIMMLISSAALSSSRSCCDNVGKLQLVSAVGDTALQPDCNCALACADLRLGLLVSGWARRATFLWAVLPLLAIGVLEKVAFSTSHFSSMLKDRVFGAGDTAFAFQPHRGVAIDSLGQLTPGRYLTTPGLWIGLAFAAAFVVIAVRQRRYQGPI